MASLTDKTISGSYKDLLQIDNSNSGVDATTRVVKDGAGNFSAIRLSDDQVIVQPINDDTSIFTVKDKSGTTILKVDSSTGGDFGVDVDGDVALDSNSGNYIMKKGGTEFSATDSAYAGMILGYTAIGIDSADDSYTTTTSMAVTDADHKVTFTAPPSGKVEIFASIYVDTGQGRPLIFGLSDNATYSAIDFPTSNDPTNEHEVYTGDETDEEQINHQWVVEGLTAGTSYTWYFGAMASTTAGAYVLRWGGDVTAEYGAFIMKATALPATIYTG